MGNKTRWTAFINDFIFIGIGYTEDPLSESDILFYKSFIETHPQKFTLIAAHNYLNSDLKLSELGMSIKYNLVMKPQLWWAGMRIITDSVQVLLIIYHILKTLLISRITGIIPPEDCIPSTEIMEVWQRLLFGMWPYSQKPSWSGKYCIRYHRND